MNTPPLNPEFRCGFIALIGRPNAGKSTLLNLLIGEELALATPLPQTTRKNLKGIYTDAKQQIIFIDTPGIHEGSHELNERMITEAASSFKNQNADCICYLIDLTRPFGAEEDRAANLVQSSNLPFLLVFNKCDKVENTQKVQQEFFTRFPCLKDKPSLIISAIDKTFKDGFLSALWPLLPIGPAHYDAEELTDASMRHFASEAIRKHIILNTREEVPHSVFVEIFGYQEFPDHHEIEAYIHVETVGQRGIIVGKGGEIIEKVRRRAQGEMKRLAGVPVTIKTHIKITPDWRNNGGFLREAGYEKDSKK